MALQKMADPGAAAAFDEGHGAEHPLPLPAAMAYVMLPAAYVRAGYGDFLEFGPVVRLGNALREERPAYQLVVAVPPGAPDDLRGSLAREGCVVLEVHPLKYEQPGHPLCIFQVCTTCKSYVLLITKLAYSNEESPDMVAWLAVDAELAALLCNTVVPVHEPGVPFVGALLGKNSAAEKGALYSNAARFAPREPGTPLGEALLGKNLAAELGAPYANATMSTRDRSMPLGEAFLGKNRAAGLDAPYSNTAVFSHKPGMAAGEVLCATTASPYAVQVFIDEAMGAKACGPIAVGTKAAGADAGDARGRAGNLSAIVGIVAASSAVTAIAGGGVSPAVAFGFFLVLLGGLSLAVSTVRGV